MAIDRMKKVAIFGMAEEFANISHGLQRLSMLHIANIETLDNVSHDDGGESLTRADSRLNKVEAALVALKPYDKSKRGMLSAKPRMIESELMAVDNEQNWCFVEQAISHGQQLPVLRSRFLQAQNALETLSPYEKVEMRISDLRKSQHAFMALGSVPIASYDALCADAQALGALVETIDLKKDLRTVFVAVHKSQQESMQPLLSGAGFTDANLTIEGTVKEEQLRLQADIEDIKRQTEQIEKALDELSKHISQLQMLFDYCSVLRTRATLALESGRTSKAFYLTGWVRERQADQLTEKLTALSDTIVVDFPEIKEGEMPPTAMRNGKFLHPFESVTEMYSSPSPYEADPTFAMAPFFLCFFGMMVSDAAYGIILTVLSIVILKLMKPSGMMGQIVVIIAMGGVSTLIWGAVFGSWFGEALLPPLWTNPLEQPIPMLLLCLGIGMIHITTGILMKAKALIKEHKYLGAFFDCGFVLFVLWGAVATFAGVSFGLTIVYTGLIGIFLTAGRDRKGIMKKFTGGFGAVYGLSGYLSDVLSYSRLFGMGIATGVIAMVFNTIAGMLMGTIPGFIIAVAVLIIGHGFNIAINTLGAYVHASRLQYIEFYNKFFEGGGRAFVPFTFKTKYVQLIQG